MQFLLLREAIVLVATFIAAYTDVRTGLIYDRITYPMIAIGIAFNLLDFNVKYFLLPAIVFATTFVLYFAGKVGGGDVKLLTGITLLLPFFEGQIFLLDILFASALSSIVVLSIWLVGKYFRKGIEWKENLPGIVKAVFLGSAIILYLTVLVQLHILNLVGAVILSVMVFFAVLFMAFEYGIRKNFFLKKVKLKDLEEDEIVAFDFLDLKIKEKLGLKFKGILGEKEIKKLKELNVKEVPVYRSLPPFAPFLFLGTLTSILFPNILLSLIVS